MSPVSGDISTELQERVRAAGALREPLNIIGGGTKSFYGRPAHGTPLHVAAHRGIVDYAPSEMVITARAGTPLAEIERLLAGERQMLGFEPPHFGVAATLGGTIACGFSGPRRPYAGGARDFVLGAACLAGTGEILRFGGRVMKNVAGYDVSRLLAGSLGTLGVLLDVSLKVVPKPEREVTVVREARPDEAMSLLARFGQRPLPLSAAAFDGQYLRLRLSGSEVALTAARAEVGGDVDPDGGDYWVALREQSLPFFASDLPLWRISLAPAAPVLNLSGDWLYDWGGAQRWLLSAGEPGAVRQAASAFGGHATCFRGGNRDEVFHPLSPSLSRLHKRLKDAFDLHGIMNPHRLYREW